MKPLTRQKKKIYVMIEFNDILYVFKPCTKKEFIFTATITIVTAPLVTLGAIEKNNTNHK